MLFGRFSSDARTLVVTTNTAILWDITEPDNPRELGQTGAYDTESISVVSIAPDGRTLATVASRGVELWDITNPEQPSPMTMLTALPNGQVEELAFAPDGRSLAVAVGDLVTLWELGPNGPQPRGKPLSGHTSSVTSMAFTPDSRTLITTSRDKTAILWNLAASDLAPPVSQPFDGAALDHECEQNPARASADDSSKAQEWRATFCQILPDGEDSCRRRRLNQSPRLLARSSNSPLLIPDPELASIFEGPVRRLVIGSSGYGLFDSVVSARASRYTALIHLSRNPQVIRDRIRRLLGLN